MVQIQHLGVTTYALGLYIHVPIKIWVPDQKPQNPKAQTSISPQKKKNNTNNNQALKPLSSKTHHHPRLHFKTPQIPSGRDHKALNRGTLGGLGTESPKKPLAGQSGLCDDLGPGRAARPGLLAGWSATLN